MKKHRLRSPGYPLIDLKEAIHRTMILWRKDKSNPIPKEVSYEHLGYKTKGGYAGRIVAALKHFGLISEKHGDIILTQDAIDLAIHEPEDENYINIIKKIALNPVIYNKIYNEYKGAIPSNATLKVKLIKDYGFNPDKVSNFINNFHSTLNYAELSEEEIEIDEMATNLSNKSIEADAISTSLKVSGKTTISYPIPLSGGKNVALVFESLPIEKKDVEAIKKWLEYFSDNLTENGEV